MATDTVTSNNPDYEEYINNFDVDIMPSNSNVAAAMPAIPDFSALDNSTDSQVEPVTPNRPTVLTHVNAPSRPSKYAIISLNRKYTQVVEPNAPERKREHVRTQ